MDFKEKLNEYIEQLGCTSKELAQASGLSAATISRYRSGERLPQWDSENYNKLIAGLSGLAQEKCISSLTESAISETLSIFSENTFVDIHRLQTNFNYLLNTLSLNVSELSRALNYDASYISRIRNGQRKPADPQEFATKITDFVTHKYQDVAQKSQIAALIGCDADAFKDPDIYRTSLFHWLTDQTQPSKNYMADFLKKLEQFDLNEYIRAIHFDEMKVPTAPFQFPTSRSYYGLKEMMDSELAFLKATVLSKSVEPVAMYSDMPMGEMAKDPEFPKKWMFGMAVMLKKGLHLNQIHNLDRSFEDMMLGLESWIPMYMTGQISPYYLKGSPGNIFSHFLKVSGTAALSGEAICGYHSEGRYYLTKNKEEVAHYRKRADRLLSKASPLMKIYRLEQAQDFQNFRLQNAHTHGERHYILSSLSLYTMTDGLLEQILAHNQLTPDEQAQIIDYVRSSRDFSEELLAHSPVTEEIPLLTEEEFAKYPMTLSLSGMFLEKDVFYTWEEYQTHLHLLQEYHEKHPLYHVKPNSSPAFRNIQICILRGKYVMVSKEKAPSIHFLIQHPKMVNAFENMIIPVTEEETAPY